MNNYVRIKAAHKRRRIARRGGGERARENEKEKGFKKTHFVGFADKADKTLSLRRAK